MLTLRNMAPRLNLPTSMSVWLLEGGIALVLSAYLAFQCYQPLVGALSRSFGTQAGSIFAMLLLLAILLPLLWLLLTMLVVLMGGLLAPTTRTVLDVLVLTLLITVLAVPLLRDAANAMQSPQSDARSASLALATGPLNSAPAPLKIERIPLGVEVMNAGTEPLEITVLFVKLNERGRSYCGGKALPAPSNNGRSRLPAGERMIFTSGNCQDGHVALTVWDTAGKRLYQTSATLPTDKPDQDEYASRNKER